MILQFVLDTFTPKWKLLSVSITGMSIVFSLKIKDTILNPDLDTQELPNSAKHTSSGSCTGKLLSLQTAK